MRLDHHPEQLSEPEGLSGRTPAKSLCPLCLDRLPARYVRAEDTVYLVKTCPAHGEFRTPVWRGSPSFDGWRRPKVPAQPPVRLDSVEKGCPFDCGLCSNHRQRSCTILIEVTDRCDLNCPVCYADAGGGTKRDPSMDEIRNLFRVAWEAGRNSNIQLSGGEPTVRDDLPEIVALGRETGFSFVQLNTNGIRIGRDPSYLRALKNAGLASVFLQFDAVDDAVYRKLRGRNLLEEKRLAVDACAGNGIGVVLTPTLVPDINTGSIGAILKAAIRWIPTVRAVHFQPISYFGRFFPGNGKKKRITLPEIMRAVESQTDGLFEARQFTAPGCENALCSFHGSFLTMPDGRMMPLSRTAGTCCPPPTHAHQGAAKAMAYVARQWSAPENQTDMNGSDDGTGENASGGDCSGPLSLDGFIARAKTHTFSVSAMAFQDVWNVDLARTRDCCIHVVSPDHRLIPFCLYNLTSARNKRLYRS